MIRRHWTSISVTGHHYSTSYAVTRNELPLLNIIYRHKTTSAVTRRPLSSEDLTYLHYISLTVLRHHPPSFTNHSQSSDIIPSHFPSFNIILKNPLLSWKIIHHRLTSITVTGHQFTSLTWEKDSWREGGGRNSKDSKWCSVTGNDTQRQWNMSILTGSNVYWWDIKNI